MNKRRLYRAVLVLGTVGLVLTVACGLWLRSARRQEALNRQLIAALVRGDLSRHRPGTLYDYQKALSLVNAGADPNTPLKPLPAPSLQQLWNYLVRRSPLPVNHSPTAFLLACGSDWTESANEKISHKVGGENIIPLIQAMLQHGANIEAKDVKGWTPLMWAAYYGDPKLVSVLLAHGANVNARSYEGETSLYWVVIDAVYPKASDTKNLLSQLLAHGADPNLSDPNGGTPLQVAQLCERPDLVALLKQAGAKK